MAMLYESIDFAPDCVDAAVVEQAIALLHEANGDIDSQTEAKMFGIMSTSVQSTDELSTPIKIVLSGSECTDLLSYASMWRLLPDSEDAIPWEIGALFEYEQQIKITRTMVSMRRACEEVEARTTNQIVIAIQDALAFSDQVTGQLMYSDLFKMLDILRDNKYENCRDDVFEKTAKILPLAVEMFKRHITVFKEQTRGVAASLLKFKTSTEADRKQLDNLLPLSFDNIQAFIGEREISVTTAADPWPFAGSGVGGILANFASPFVVRDVQPVVTKIKYPEVKWVRAYRADYLSKMTTASKAASDLCAFFTQQAACYDKISLYLSALSLPARMEMLKNRKTFIVDGSNGALARSRDLQADYTSLNTQVEFAFRYLKE